jgi:ribonuclease-3
MEKLQKNIFYQFNDIDLLKQALTHRSLINNNERLEFLGDSLLSCIISYELYHRFPLVDEGRLTRIRSRLVRGQTQAELAKKLNLSEFLLLDTNELKSGYYGRESIQSDAFEAILGAIFLDSDYLTVSTVVLKIYDDLLNDINPEDSLKNYKTQLQELLQKKGYSLPKYEVIETKDTTAELDAVSYVSCHIKEYNLTVEKKAESIKRAEQACAKSLIERLASS